MSAVPQLSHVGIVVRDIERGTNHGNALSICFADPEQNTVEVYLDTPCYLPQPHGDPLDLEKTDAEIGAETEATCRADPGFEPVAQWSARFSFPASPARPAPTIS